MGSEIQRVDSKQSTATTPNGHTSSSSSSTSPTLALTPDGIAELAIFIDEHDVQNGARQVLHSIRPSWRDEHIQFKLFTDGITNKLVGCFHRPPVEEEVHENGQHNGHHNGCTNGGSSIEAATTADQIERLRENTVLIRVYGNKTDMLIDRKAETRNIRMLHEYGFAPSLFATFKNGLAYEYVPGVTLKPETVVLENIYTLVARQMAEMHKVRHEGIDPKGRVPMVESQVSKFLNLLPAQLSDSDKAQKASQLGIPGVADLRKEFDSLYEHLKRLDSPIVFAHNDLLLGNVIYTAEQERVTFIDYEYADYNYAAFDIGNHFTEFPGIDQADYSLYPNREFQLKWLAVYLEAYLGKGKATEAAVERLYVQVNQFALASHFIWLVWGVIQAEYSSIDFDFLTFASNRHREYLRRKDGFLALRYGEEDK